MTREELEFIMNDFGSCFIFPCSDVLKCVRIRKGKKETKYTKGTYLRAAMDFDSSPNAEIFYEFTDDFFNKSEDYTHDLLYLN